jgi:hypothetical protein
MLCRPNYEGHDKWSWLFIVVKVALFVNARMFIGISCVLLSTKPSLAHAERLKKV